MANLNTAISPAPAVTCLTTGGAVATGYTGDVTVALSTNPTGATLSGTLTVSATAGVATFSDLTLNRSGKNFKLSATASGLRTTTSAAFSIPTHLEFFTQPATTAARSTMADVVVIVRDSASNTDTTYTGNITIAIYSATAAGVLSGTKTVAAVAGVATFSTLSINVAGTYTFIASASEISTAYKPASVVSNSFIVDDYVINIVSDIENFDVLNAFTNAYGTPPPSVSLTVIVGSGVIVSSPSTASPAMTWGLSWSGSPSFKLINNGYIVGKGGAGGNGSGQSPTVTVPGTVGTAGGTALSLNTLATVSITNASGRIWGGGGGGGGGAAVQSTIGSGTGFCGGGGGGSGAGNGTGGTGGESYMQNDYNLNSASENGANESGSLATQNGTPGGAGADADDTLTFETLTGGAGGAGGDYGAAGTNGVNSGGGTAGPSVVEAATAAGAAGAAITGTSPSFVSGSGSPNVKGSVS